MVDSFELLCKLTTEERENQDTFHRLSAAKKCRTLLKEEIKELDKAIAQQTENEIAYNNALDKEFKT